MKLGVIADDFSGATDIAGFLMLGGCRTIMCTGIPDAMPSVDADAVVVSMKIRSCPAKEASVQAVEALRFLQSLGCDRFYFKYCSTFDSTDEGNIGPVTDSLMKHLGTEVTVICPALPVNGRTVYQGYLFVHDQLLNESSMRYHPITPMRDAKLSRLMQVQFSGTSAQILHADIVKGSSRIESCIEMAKAEGANYLITDALDEQDLCTIAEATERFPLVTGGSGLAIGITTVLRSRHELPDHAVEGFKLKQKRGVVIAGSCALRTNEQVAAYRQLAPALRIEEESCLDDPTYPQHLASWILAHQGQALAPMIYATKSEQELHASKERFGDAVVAVAIERVIAETVAILRDGGTETFIAAGGETSGVVAATLAIDTYKIGAQVDPGVSWISSLDERYQVIYKSGNFGSVDFFQNAQSMCETR